MNASGLATPHHMDFFRLLSEENDPKLLMKKFLELLLGLQQVERGSIWLAADEAFECVAASGEESADIVGLKVPKDSPSIVGWVFENAKMTLAEPGKDHRHFKDAEVSLDVKSTLILAFPLIVKDGSVYGCVEIIETNSGRSRMTLDPKYLELLRNLVDICSIILSNSLDILKKNKETLKLQATIDSLRDKQPIIGPDRVFAEVMAKAEQFASTEYPVLITGESGSGKEVVAREVHRKSRRTAKPFLAQNCGAIPENLLLSEFFGHKRGSFTGAESDKIGLFEAAHGGTLFLDEIGDMPLDLQTVLLRTLQEKEIKPVGGHETKTVDVRIIAATNRNLEEAVAAGTFRQDLYYRLNVLPLRLPPLRDRAEDIPYFLSGFIGREAAGLGVAPKEITGEAMELLCGYDWPGNVRELENLVKQLMTLAGPHIEPEDLPPHLKGPPPGEHVPSSPSPSTDMAFGGCTWDEVERKYMLHLLESNRWVVSEAARQAGLKRSTFDSRLKKCGIRKFRKNDVP